MRSPKRRRSARGFTTAPESRCDPGWRPFSTTATGTSPSTDGKNVYVAARGGKIKFKQYHALAGNYVVIDAAGTDIRRLDAIGLVVETGCRFRRELGFPEDVEVGLAVEKLGTSSIVYEIGLFQGSSAEPAAIGRFVHVYVTRADRAVTPVPDVIRTAVAPLVR